MPGADPAALSVYRWPVEVTANGPDLQAVRHRELGIAGAVFHRAGRAPLGAGRCLAVDGPAAILLREIADAILLAASSPDHREGVLTISLSMRLAGEGARLDPDGGTLVSVDLPEGPLAGSSVVRKLVPADHRAG